MERITENRMNECALNESSKWNKIKKNKRELTAVTATAKAPFNILSTKKSDDDNIDDVVNENIYEHLRCPITTIMYFTWVRREIKNKIKVKKISTANMINRDREKEIGRDS